MWCVLAVRSQCVRVRDVCKLCLAGTSSFTQAAVRVAHILRTRGAVVEYVSSVFLTCPLKHSLDDVGNR